MASATAPARAKAKRSSDLGAGLSLSKPSAGDHPGGPVQHGAMGQAERGFTAASTFVSGMLAISASQFIGAPLKYVDPKFYDGYMAWTKESFAVLVTTMTQWWSPTVVRVTGDDSMKDQLYQMEDGTLKCNFPHRMVMMANHQLYTDWLYLWWIAYTNKMHGRIYIILKESLKNVPIFGWAAQFYNFIFLARKWETDKPRFKRALQHLSNPLDPMWLLIFPEGTNLSKTTREKSKAWAEKQGVPDMKHQLLPRSTGLRFCLEELKPSTNWLYDCTIAYEGVPEGQFGQDIFTLRSSLFEGRPPKSVNMYWRRWRISDIPTDNEDAFAMWLRNRWTEKDYLLEHFFRHGTYPDGDLVKAMKMEAVLEKFAKTQRNGDSKTAIKVVPKSAKFITTEVKAGGWEEFSGIFSPVATAATAISSGELSPDNIDFEALLAKVAQQQSATMAITGKGSKTAEEARKVFMEAYQQAGKSPLGPVNGQAVPSTKLTKGQRLDPEVRKVIEDANERTRQRLEKAARPANAKGPNVRNNLPMAPMETFVTRPLSTIAVQRAAQRLQMAGPTVGAKSASASDAVQRAAGRPATKQNPVITNGTAKKAPHPLAGRSVGRSKGHTPIGQKKEVAGT